MHGEKMEIHAVVTDMGKTMTDTRTAIISSVLDSDAIGCFLQLARVAKPEDRVTHEMSFNLRGYGSMAHAFSVKDAGGLHKYFGAITQVRRKGGESDIEVLLKKVSRKLGDGETQFISAMEFEKFMKTDVWVRE